MSEKMTTDGAYSPYDPKAMCPKCGGGDIGTAHVPAKRCTDACHDPAHRWPEHLARCCRRCRWMWRERVVAS